jgi:hypothetical protein
MTKNSFIFQNTGNWIDAQIRAGEENAFAAKFYTAFLAFDRGNGI